MERMFVSDKEYDNIILGKACLFAAEKRSISPIIPINFKVTNYTLHFFFNMSSFLSLIAYCSVINADDWLIHYDSVF